MNIPLQEHEQIQRVIHLSWLSLWRPLLIGGVLMILPFFFLFSLMVLGKPGIMLLAFFELIGIVVVIRAFFLWDSHRVVVTNQREIRLSRTSLFRPAVLEITSVELSTQIDQV
ncbi:hypothetical protein EXS71_00620 [Candidatus Uhrbacteria bacterium]|nr:hypothetical protein [Candidatus Uhrbacteria bacterium]